MYPRTTGYLLSFPALLCVGPNSGRYQGPRMKALLHGTVIVFSSQIFLRRHCKSAPGSPTSDLRAVKQNWRRQSTGSSRGYKAPVPSYREVFCSMRLFFVCLLFRRPLSTKTGETWNLCGHRKKHHFQKLVRVCYFPEGT